MLFSLRFYSLAQNFLRSRKHLTSANKTTVCIQAQSQQSSLYRCPKMTKLMQWLFFGVLFLSFWISLVTKKINHYILEEYSTVVLFLPAILIILFGVYAASVVLWRVYTFNDCEEAALELKKQIQEARADLKARGFQFKEEKT